MTFFCYVYSQDSSVPHMEALDSPTLFEAKTRSSKMLTEHRNAIRAELFDEERRVATISRQDAAERLSEAYQSL